jgi:hypothetical protein
MQDHWPFSHPRGTRGKRRATQCDRYAAGATRKLVNLDGLLCLQDESKRSPPDAAK